MSGIESEPNREVRVGFGGSTRPYFIYIYLCKFSSLVLGGDTNLFYFRFLVYILYLYSGKGRPGETADEDAGRCPGFKSAHIIPRSPKLVSRHPGRPSPIKSYSARRGSNGDEYGETFE